MMGFKFPVDESEDKRTPVQAATDTLTTTGLLPMPVSPMEKAIQEQGKAKVMGKMLLGGFTGMTPLLLPEIYQGNTRYKEQLKAYNEQQTRIATQEASSPYYDALNNDTTDDDLGALRQLAALQPDVYGAVLKRYEESRADAARQREVLSGVDMSNPTPADIAALPSSMQPYATDVYRGNQGGYLADQSAAAGMSYPDFMALSPEVRRWHIRKNASEADRADMDFVAGRQTPQQKADEAALVTEATETAKLTAQTKATEESRAPQLQDAFDITMQLLDSDDYRDLYGAVDGRTPTVLPESLNAQAKLERLSNILYMFARGELKGQGQVTEQEAEAARSAASTLTNFLQGDDQAYDELVRLNKKFGKILDLKPEDLWRQRPSEEDRIIDLDD